MVCKFSVVSVSCRFVAGRRSPEVWARPHGSGAEPSTGGAKDGAYHMGGGELLTMAIHTTGVLRIRYSTNLLYSA